MQTSGQLGPPDHSRDPGINTFPVDTQALHVAQYALVVVTVGSYS